MKRFFQRLLVILLSIITIGLGGLATLSFVSTRPNSLGVIKGRLADLPDSPNCVSSQASHPAQRVDPILYEGDMQRAKQKLVDIVRGMKGSSVVTDSENYLHFEFRSRVFRFTDDVEFLVDDENKQIHIRSASRVGYSDMGVNRKRVQRITELFETGEPK